MYSNIVIIKFKHTIYFILYKKVIGTFAWLIFMLDKASDLLEECYQKLQLQSLNWRKYFLYWNIIYLYYVIIVGLLSYFHKQLINAQIAWILIGIFTIGNEYNMSS